MPVTRSDDAAVSPLIHERRERMLTIMGASGAINIHPRTQGTRPARGEQNLPRPNGKHLWQQNDGSTMISRRADSRAVTFITSWSAWRHGRMTFDGILALVGSSHTFRPVVAALDPIPLYLGVQLPAGCLQIDPTVEHDGNSREDPVYCAP